MSYPDVGKKEIEFLQRLSGYSTHALHYAKARYEQACSDGDIF